MRQPLLLDERHPPEGNQDRPSHQRNNVASALTASRRAAQLDATLAHFGRLWREAKRQMQLVVSEHSCVPPDAVSDWQPIGDTPIRPYSPGYRCAECGQHWQRRN